MDHFRESHDEFCERVTWLFEEMQERLVHEYEHVLQKLKVTIIKCKQQTRRKLSAESATDEPPLPMSFPSSRKTSVIHSTSRKNSIMSLSRSRKNSIMGESLSRRGSIQAGIDQLGCASTGVAHTASQQQMKLLRKLTASRGSSCATSRAGSPGLDGEHHGMVSGFVHDPHRGHQQALGATAPPVFGKTLSTISTTSVASARVVSASTQMVPAVAHVKRHSGCGPAERPTCNRSSGTGGVQGHNNKRLSSDSQHVSGGVQRHNKRPSRDSQHMSGRAGSKTHAEQGHALGVPQRAYGSKSSIVSSASIAGISSPSIAGISSPGKSGPAPPGEPVNGPPIPSRDFLPILGDTAVEPMARHITETMEDDDDDDDGGDWQEQSMPDEDDDDEVEFTVLPEWNKQDNPKKSSIHGARAGSILLESLVDQMFAAADELQKGASLGSLGTQRESGFMFHPTSLPRLTWDFLCMILVFCDVVFVPLDFVEPQDSLYNLVIEWIGRCFWTLDIPINLRTGYFDTYGTLQMSVKHCQRRYLHTWIGVDLALVILGWVEGIALMSADDGTLWRRLRWCRAIRIARLVRLGRILRLAGTFDLIRWRVQSEAIMLLASICKHAGGILVFAHIFACLWYAVSRSCNGAVNRWIDRYQLTNTRLPSVMARYSYAFLWALGQFTTFGLFENTDVDSAGEVMYGVFTMLFTFVISACFVSMITTSMTSFTLLNEKSLVQTTALRKFLLDHDVSASLAARVQRNALHVMQEKDHHTPEKDVELLQVVSKPLRMELRYELFQPYMTQHILFKLVEHKDRLAFSAMCSTAVSEVFTSAKDVVFAANEMPTAPAMLFIAKGTSKYFWGQMRSENIEENTTCCEAFMWTEWIYMGTLCATSPCRLLALDSALFRQVLRDSARGPDYLCIQLYAREFVQFLNKIDLLNLSDFVPPKHLRACAARAFNVDEDAGTKRVFAQTSNGTDRDTVVTKLSNRSENSVRSFHSRASSRVVQLLSGGSQGSIQIFGLLRPSGKKESETPSRIVPTDMETVQ